MKKEELFKFIHENSGNINDTYLKNIGNLYTIKYGDISKHIPEERISKILYESKCIDANDYTKIENAKNKKGIYIFYRRKSEKEIEFLYVGECHTSTEDRSLDSRIKQHFIVSDTGGLIYKISNGDKKEGIKLRNNFIQNVKLAYFFSR